MSDTIKLSELLEAAASDSEGLGYEMSYSGSAHIERGRTLRAIAPALVEIAAADQATGRGEFDSGWRVYHARVALRKAMKEAGVTCE